MKLSERQVVPLTCADLAALRAAAESREITPGLFSRALLRFGLAHLDDLDDADAVAAEKAEAAERVKAGAREAVAHRWGS